MDVMASCAHFPAVVSGLAGQRRSCFSLRHQQTRLQQRHSRLHCRHVRHTCRAGPENQVDTEQNGELCAETTRSLQSRGDESKHFSNVYVVADGAQLGGASSRGQPQKLDKEVSH